ncbi:hypothetical protein [Salibacterium halotolerans]|uniref:hypothetical protein n=1 Tax=Salibacterium halotolerans TaxID=1884432 RepID=UPI00147DBA29|nr:hypothetical protein [Salibacterium halotolerans]
MTRVRYGEESSEDGHLKLQVFIVIAVYDESGNHQGHRDVLNIVQKVVNNLHHFRILNKTFERDFPLRWDYEDEDTFPVYFGTIETNWIMPETERKDVRDLI